MKWIAILAIASSLSCARHPALTVGIGGASIGLASCEIQGSKQSTCGLITGIVGLGLGGLAWLVTELADTNAHELPPDDEMLPDGTVRVHTRTELPPVPLDAGVSDAPPVHDGPAPAPAIDAGVSDAT